MKWLWIVLLAGCSGPLTIDMGNNAPVAPIDSSPILLDYQYPKYSPELPTVNLPEVLRQSNWLGQQGEGSCVHAAMISLFRWQGRADLADYWRNHYGDGEWPHGLAEKLDCEGVRYAYTAGENDVAFLEWACSTRRGAGVTCMGGRHMVALVHLDSKRAGILDNNSVSEIKWYPREQFLSEWINSNSWAVTPVYTPAAPLPYSP